MRILMIIDGLPGGGAEKTVLTLSSGLTELGHQVTLFSLRKVCDYAIPEGIDFQVVQDTCKKPWRKLTEIPRRARLLDRAIEQAERSGKFDVVFSHLHKTDRIVAHSRVLDRDKVWFCVHGMFSFSYLRHRSGLSRWFKHYKIRHTYENRNVVAVSGAVLHDLSEVLAIPLRRKAVIHNPFDIPEIQRLAEAPFKMQGQDYIIHVGRSDAKINQLKQLAAKLGIENKIVFRPFETNPYPWIKGARLLVLSSDCEGFGNVLVESIICQTPPVSTNCPGGPAEILTGPLARGLTALTDESLAKTLAELYASPPVVDRETIASFGINAICQQYIALVDNQK